MKCFSFNRFKTFAAKHYAEYGRNYKIAMLVLLSIWALFAIMEHSGIIGDDILNTKQVVTIAALVGMLSNVTASSMGSLNCKNDIIDLTLPVTTLERFTFIMLNSFVLGVVVPTFLLDIPAQQLLPTLCTMTLLHAALMVVADGHMHAADRMALIFLPAIDAVFQRIGGNDAKLIAKLRLGINILHQLIQPGHLNGVAGIADQVAVLIFHAQRLHP